MAFGLSTADLPTGSTILNSMRSVVPAAPPILAAGQASLITTLSDTARSALFQNPVSDAISSLSGSVTGLQAKVTSIAADVTDPRQADAVTMLAGTTFSDLTTGLTNFSTHTGRLSGTLQGLGVNVPGLDSVLSVSKQMSTYSNLLSGAGDCLQMAGAMTGLFSTEALGGHTDTINNALSKLNNGINTFAELTAQVSGIKNQIATIIAKDTQFLTNSISQLKTIVTSSILAAAASDPCGRFILTQVGSAGLLSKIPGL